MKKFWINVLRGEGCWEWLGGKSKGGYGFFYVRKRGDKRSKTLYAHRVAYEITYGKIPDGLCLDHLCRNRACVNPGHLEIVTFAENTRRGERAQRTHCPQGHAYNQSNTYMSKKGRSCKVCHRLRQGCNGKRIGLSAVLGLSRGGYKKSVCVTGGG